MTYRVSHLRVDSRFSPKLISANEFLLSIIILKDTMVKFGFSNGTIFFEHLSW